jgi:hypothetical protein
VKRPMIITAGLLLTLGMMSGAAFAQEDWGTETITFRRCVDLAGGKALPKPNHHTKVHTGRPGQVLYENAGHAVVPTSPLTPFANCEELGDSPIVIPLGEE